MRVDPTRRLICLVLAAAVTVSGCRPPAPPSRVTPAPTPVTPPASAAGAAGSAASAAGRPQVPIASGSQGVLTARVPDLKAAAAGPRATPLPDAEAQRLLARLEPLPALSGDPAPALRPPSPPPPAAAPAHPIAFAIPTGKPVADAPIVPRAVLPPLPPPQISPEGEVTAESEVRIRFSEPMVPVAQIGATAIPPVTIAPAVPGAWRWLDSRVLVFTTAAPRFPAATEIVVTVPAGVRAVSGAVLDDPVEARFATPPPQITGLYPSAAVRPDSPIAIQIDQRVDPAQLLPLLVVRGPTGAPLAFRAIERGEADALWAKNPRLHGDPGHADPLLGRHHVLIAPRSAWPAGATLSASLRPGAPSLEGPRRSVRETSARFYVVPPFTVRGVACDDHDEPRLTGQICAARGYARIELSNSVEPSTFRAERVQLAGQPFEDHYLSGSSVGISLPAGAGRALAVVLGEGLSDVYGQPLVGPRRSTFALGPERFDPRVDAPTGLHVLDPRFEIPQWVIRAEAIASLRVQLYQVEPRDYFAFAAYERGERAAPPGRKITDVTHAVGARNGARVRVDLRPALAASGLGHVVAVATPTGAPSALTPQIAWIQVTRLGITARFDGERARAWVQDVSPDRFLAPRAGVDTAIWIEGRPAPSPTATDADGHATFELPPPGPPPPPPPPRQPPSYPRDPINLLVASAGGDATFDVLSGRAERATRHERAYWYATDDRFTYKPGEPLYVKGWVRWTHDGTNPDLALPAAGDAVAYALVDARGVTLATGSAPLSGQGGFDLAIDLPPNANLGTARLSLSTRGSGHTLPISIQEFRTPAFAVALADDVTHGGAAPLILGESIEMSATARYYAGGGLPGARLEWSAGLTPAAFAPPGWDLFDFSPPTARDDGGGAATSREATALSGASSASIVYGVAALPAGRPSVLAVDATVTDVDRMTIRATSRPILVHPSSYYVGLRLRPGDPNTLEAIVTDIDGAPVAGVPIDVAIDAVLGSEADRADARLLSTQRCQLTSAATPAACPFQRVFERPADPASTSKNGRSLIYPALTATARIADPRGRANAARLALPWYARDDRRDLAVIPDRAEYRPGDVAKLDIRSKVVPATAIVSFARQGVIAQRRVELTGPSTLVELPIDAAYIQNVHVVVDRLGRRQRPRAGSAAPLPEDTTVAVDLPVQLASARLVMRARPLQPLVEPGARATFEVEVRRDGKPVAGAEVALMVIDEAVLALASRAHEDPLPAFYRRVGQGTWKASTLPNVHDSGEDLAGAPGIERFRLEDELGYGRYGTGTGSGYGAGGASIRMGAALGGNVVQARKDFRATAVFSPRLATGPDGKIALTIDMPDSLTRYRVIALAAADLRYFGKAESTIVAARKVTARTVAPRFLSQGDSFALPVVLQNLDAAPRTVDVAARAANLTAVGPAAQRITIPAGQRAEVRFRFATAARGKVTLQTIAVSGGLADASQVELPVYEPATTEAFATYGTVDDAPRVEQLAVPADVFPDVGGVSVELASTQLQALTDAYWYLYAYPYECAEQRSSRMLATAAVYDILDAFATPGRPSRQEIADTLARDVAVLAQHQLPDGGWGYFPGMKGDPFVTLQVTAALAAHHIKNDATRRAAAFVGRQAAELIGGLERAAAAPPHQRPDRGALAVRIGLAAHALSVLGQTGADVRARAERLHALATELAAYPVDAKARLLALVAKLPRAAAMRATLAGALRSATHETAAAATVAARFEEAERLLLVSTPRTTALALDALLRESPEHALVPKLVRGLLDGRRGGRWGSTQENLAALTALRRYFDTFEKREPAFTGKLWLGAAAYAEQAFVGRGQGPVAAGAGWTALPPGSTHDLVIAKDGPGRLYYRVGITYAPRRADLPPLDAGFVVRRSYTAVDDPGDVTRTPDGNWRIRLGARVLVTLEAINTTARHGVALVDPLPAGFEAVNEALATAERAVAAPDNERWDHVAMRDTRAEVFAMHLREGSHRFSYTARATTPGTFAAAPAKAEEMYSPETFGRSAGQIVVIE